MRVSSGSRLRANITIAYLHQHYVPDHVFSDVAYGHSIRHALLRHCLVHARLHSLDGRGLFQLRYPLFGLLLGGKETHGGESDCERNGEIELHC